MGGERDLVELALRDPRAAMSAVEKRITETMPLTSLAEALRARGLARRQLGEFEQSEIDLVEALDLVDLDETPNLWAGVGLTLAGTWAQQGKIDDAKDLLSRCIDIANGPQKAEALYQLGTTHAQAGDLDGALQFYAKALPLVVEAERPAWLANLFGNRGTMYLHRGSYDQAIADFDRALDLGSANQASPQGPIYMSNKALALHLQGDIAAAIDLFDEAERLQEAKGLPTLVFSHRARAHLATGMYEEALETARKVHEFHTAEAATVGAIEALIAGADAALALGKFEHAEVLCRRVQSLDQKGHFPVWNEHAEIISQEILLEVGEPSYSAEKALASYEQYSGQSAVVANRALLLGAKCALRSREVEGAMRLLSTLEHGRSTAPLHMQLEYFDLRARLGDQVGDRSAVIEALSKGLDAFTEMVASSDYNTVARATRHVERLVGVAVESLITAGELPRVLASLELVRTLPIKAHDPEYQPGVADPSHSETSLTWCRTGSSIICIVRDSDHLSASVCGDVGEISGLVEAQKFAYRQLARSTRLGRRADRGLRELAVGASSSLSDHLLPEGLRDQVALNPTGSLANIVWGALPGLSNRAHCVVPSLSMARRGKGELLSGVAVGSSDLPHAEAETVAVADVWGTAPAVDPGEGWRRVSNGSDVFHVAGHFRGNTANPVLSQVPLGEGTMRGNDYLELDQVPALLVLSGCASATTAPVGLTQFGFATAALAAGTTSVIATQTVIEDGSSTVKLMVELHRLLRQGIAPATVLRELRSGDSEIADLAALLVVVGGGW